MIFFLLVTSIAFIVTFRIIYLTDFVWCDFATVSRRDYFVFTGCEIMEHLKEL